MDHVAAHENQLATPVEHGARTDLAIRHKHGVSTLLSQRRDLRGVYAFADVVEESVRSSA
jgi:hypothetical protein